MGYIVHQIFLFVKGKCKKLRMGIYKLFTSGHKNAIDSRKTI